MSYEMRNVITFLLGRKKYAEYNKYYEIVWVGPCKNAMSTSKSTNYWVTGSQDPFSKKKKKLDSSTKQKKKNTYKWLVTNCFYISSLVKITTGL
jgi:hypothetical protein